VEAFAGSDACDPGTVHRLIRERVHSQKGERAQARVRYSGRADRRVERSGARIAIQRAKSLSERVASGSKCSDSTEVSNARPFNGL